MKRILLTALIPLALFSLACAQQPCAEALKAYAERYPAAEPQDLYKLVFQDLYGPGHLIDDSASCYHYIEREVREQCTGDTSPFPLYEYTLCDSNFVRINLLLVKQEVLSLEQLVSAVLRSAVGITSPEPRFVMSHSAAFKAAYDPHYRLVSRDIFERELRDLIDGRR